MKRKSILFFLSVGKKYINSTPGLIYCTSASNLYVEWI